MSSDEETRALRDRVAALERRLAESRGAEKEVLASRSMLALVLDTIPVRVFWKNRESQYLGCNRHFARDAGLARPDEIVGRNDFELGWRAQAELYRAGDRAVMEAGTAQLAYEEPQTSPDGQALWLRTSKIPLRDTDGQVVGVLGVYEDITESKRAEEARLRLEVQMQHAQKLESLGVLAGGIAHDFNNLLMAVLGNLELLRLSVPADSVASAHVEATELAAHRAAELCREMLAYSGRGRFLLRPVDLNGLVREMVELLRASISKKAELRLDLTDGLPTIEGEATQLRQVVMNLITNASEALPDGGGTIVLRTSVQSVGSGQLRDEHTQTELPSGRYLLLEVDDTGPGMDATTVRRIFEPFYTTKFTGRGLGLAAVQGIVRGHGGTIRVESAVGRGSRFAVMLPAGGAAAPSRTVRAQAVAAPGPAARQPILLVDDEAIVRAVVAQLLGRLGYTVETAADGEAALALYTPGRFACVILDVTMPRKDGVETLRELRLRDPEVRVIMASGYDADDVCARLPEGPPPVFLEKPFTLVALDRLLRQVVSGGRPG